jgi:hypothetical protein
MSLAGYRTALLRSPVMRPRRPFVKQPSQRPPTPLVYDTVSDDEHEQSRERPLRVLMTVAQLRAKLASYPDDAAVGVHVLDSRRGHRFVSARRVDMTEPNEYAPVCVVWISAVKDDE